MAQHPGLESYDLSSLRYIMWGATPVTASVAETVTRRTGVTWLPAYGASELPVIACNPIDSPRLDSVGQSGSARGLSDTANSSINTTMPTCLYITTLCIMNMLAIHSSSNNSDNKCVMPFSSASATASWSCWSGSGRTSPSGAAHA